jgi:hypothetical protein
MGLFFSSKNGYTSDEHKGFVSVNFENSNMRDLMEEEKEKVDVWVYVFVCNPGADESFLGLYNKEQDVNFIPAFQTKEEANDCFLTLPREKGKKYELQAVHIEELHDVATKAGFAVTLVDSDGKVIKE